MNDPEKPETLISSEHARGARAERMLSGKSLMPMLIGGLVLIVVSLAVVTLFV